MTRLASSPACGPGASSSTPLEPFALAPPAPFASTPVVAADAGGGGCTLGGFVLQPAIRPSETINAITIRCMLLLPHSALPDGRLSNIRRRSPHVAGPSMRERSPDGLTNFTLLGFQADPGQSVGRDGGQGAARALALRVDQSRAVRGETG